MVAMRKALVVALLGLATLALAGCVTVKPAQRATLADPTMNFDDDSHQQGQRDHAISNREGAYGGNGVAGGGCGCN